jgi:hypothetical protein
MEEVEKLPTSEYETAVKHSVRGNGNDFISEIAVVSKRNVGLCRNSDVAQMDVTYKKCRYYKLLEILARDANGKWRIVAFAFLLGESAEEVVFLLRLLARLAPDWEVRIFLIDRSHAL